MQYHPDRNPGDKSSEERFKEANEAYAVLSDPDRRAHFDRFGTAGPGAGPGFGDAGFGSLFEDIFENFFSGAPRGRRSRAVQGEASPPSTGGGSRARGPRRASPQRPRPPASRRARPAAAAASRRAAASR